VRQVLAHRPAHAQVEEARIAIGRDRRVARHAQCHHAEVGKLRGRPPGPGASSWHFAQLPFCGLLNVVYGAIATRDPDIAVAIPPRARSTPPIELGTDPSRRDVHVHTVAALGRLGWQEVTGYGRRALVETTMGRYMALIGARLRARADAGRRTEAAIGAVVLNRMLAVGRPNSVRVVRDVS
jgi:hypothetical protein